MVTEEKQKSNTKGLRELFNYSRKYFKYQKVPLALAPLELIVFSATPFLIRYFIDNIVGKAQFSMVLPFVLVFTFFDVFGRILSVIVDYGYHKSANATARDEQIYMFKKIMKMPYRDYSQNKIGDFMTRILSDTLELSFFLGAGVPVIVLNIFQVAITAGVLIYLNWKLGVLSLLFVPVYYFSMGLFNKNLQQTSAAERKSYSELTEELREKVEGLWSVKSFCKETFFSSMFFKKSDDWVKTRNRFEFFNSLSWNFMAFVYDLAPVFVLGYGGFLILRGETTLGTLMGFYSFLGALLAPVRNLSSFYIESQRAGQVAERVFEVRNLPEENAKGGMPFPIKDFFVCYDNVSFTYKDEPVLKGINLYIQPGERVAIVGTSGAGKSSLVNLLPRFYDPTSGSVKVGGIDVRDYDLADLRKNVIIVRQNDFVFNMTIKENILLDDEFTEEEFFDAVRKAKVNKFVYLLENGYDTVVGERGGKLSDRQRQRIAIARAVIRKPKILVLHEATSGVDSQMEEEIFYEQKEEDMTLVIISHRLSTIRKADGVLVLNQGRVVEEGTHEELMASSCVYKDIIESQLAV